MTDIDFDTATALTPGPAGSWQADLPDSWRIGNSVHGGVLMAVGAKALAAALDEDGAHPDPLAFSAYFLSASDPGPATLTTQILRTGRSMSTGEVSLTQPGQDGVCVERMRGLATFGDLTDRSEPRLRSAAPPPIPSPQDCLSGAGAPDFLAHATLLERMDLRLDPASAGWAVGKPSQRGVLSGWLRFIDGREPDVISVLWALDAMPPVAFDLGLYGWTPTLEFSAHLRRHPAPGWLQVELRTENVSGGLMEEDARVWDSTGALVAMSRQLCGWRAPAGS
jgi:hypothetical protein